jgi:hypothetical protein
MAQILIYRRCDCDDQKRKRFKTIGLIIEESPYASLEGLSGEAMVCVRVAFKEVGAQR